MFPKRFSSICYYFQISFFLKTLQSGFLLQRSFTADPLDSDQPNFTACRHADASTRNGDEMLEWKVIFKALISPLQSRTIIPDADLYLLASKAASKCIMSCVLASQCL
ncbi:hypothetical protein ES332_D12G055000v1 [Gossypium tomentosum]|uniref:Uncharacterized protein n=1 Tax=Gossypium tomentosum TaxID=34277 RepID=A0A5D2I631_GOSTO|nr:hypothetical protein ES332_D12G055000v1 [Gossypium tomentosum]